MDKFIDIFFFKILGVHIYVKLAECAETNEKSNFRSWQFSIFDIWSFLYSKLVNFRYKIDHN